MEFKRVIYLILIMMIVSLLVLGMAISVLYRTAITEEQARLLETAQSQARLIEAVARFNAKFASDFPGGSEAATLSQIIDAHAKYQEGFGETGEFALARREGDQIVFLLRHRHYDLDKPKSVPFHSALAEPMRMALSGRSGTLVGLDYRGETVLAAHEPVEALHLGIVAKIDLAEIKAPFRRASVLAGSFALLTVLVGSILFALVTNPMIRRLKKYSISLEEANEQLRQNLSEREKMQELLKKSRDLLDLRVKERTAELEQRTIDLRAEIGKREEYEEALKLSSQKLSEENRHRRYLSQKLVEILETDRRNVAMALHDQIGQLLTSLLREFDWLKKDQHHDNSLIERFDEAEKILRKSVEEIKGLCRDLRPHVLDHLGLVPALRSLSDEYETKSKVKIHFFAKDLPAPIDRQRELALYRITQEALTNIAKHAQATEAFVNLIHENGSIVLTIEDNGRGFNYDEAIKATNEKGPFGLLIMRERVAFVDGEFYVETAKAKGTHITVRIRQ